MLQVMNGAHCNLSTQENLHFKASLDNKNNPIFKTHTNGLVTKRNSKVETSIDPVRKSAGLDLEHIFFSGSYIS